MLDRSPRKEIPWDCLATFGTGVGKHDPNQAHLPQWPLKLSMISPLSPYFHNGQLLLSADCAAFSYRSFHEGLLRGRVLVIGCPYLNGPNFERCLTEIVRLNDLRSIGVVRMDAPCCQGITDAVMSVVRKSGKDIPLQFVTIFAEGDIME